VYPCISISCSRRLPLIRRRKADRANWLTQDHKQLRAAKSRLSLRRSSYTISLMNTPSLQRHTTRMCQAKCYLLSNCYLFRASFSVRQLSEAEFWKRYFQSKLFHSHRASIRSTATQHVVKDDAIFDKYLEKPDDGEFPCTSERNRPR
jgi:hypothetical protein